MKAFSFDAYTVKDIIVFTEKIVDKTSAAKYRAAAWRATYLGIRKPWIQLRQGDDVRRVANWRQSGR